LKLHKVKRPAGSFTFDVEPVAEDEHGTWLSALQGAAWRAPHDTGTLPFDVLLLISDTRYWGRPNARGFERFAFQFTRVWVVNEARRSASLRRR
jgi:hypothetical protein